MRKGICSPYASRVLALRILTSGFPIGQKTEINALPTAICVGTASVIMAVQTVMICGSITEHTIVCFVVVDEIHVTGVAAACVDSK